MKPNRVLRTNYMHQVLRRNLELFYGLWKFHSRSTTTRHWSLSRIKYVQSLNPFLFLEDAFQYYPLPAPVVFNAIPFCQDPWPKTLCDFFIPEIHAFYHTLKLDTVTLWTDLYSILNLFMIHFYREVNTNTAVSNFNTLSCVTFWVHPGLNC